MFISSINTRLAYTSMMPSVMISSLMVLILIISDATRPLTASSDVTPTQPVFTQQPLPDHILALMIGKSLPDNITWPVKPDDLRYLTISHWGYDNQIHKGRLVMHKAVADEVLEIFKELFFDHQFPIERMQLIDLYDANDDASMAANNTSAFCCRSITDKPGIFSNHSYGLAIDINPRINPYIKWSPDRNKWLVYPENGREFVDLPADGVSFPTRTESYRGIIIKNSACYLAFKKRGWDWGGDWTQETHGKNYKDYQHFAKEPKEVGLE